MKKLLTILGSIGLVATTGITLVSCTETPTKSSDEIKFLQKTMNNIFKDALEKNPVESAGASKDGIINYVKAELTNAETELNANGIFAKSKLPTELKTYKSLAEFDEFLNDAANKAEIEKYQKDITTAKLSVDNIIISDEINIWQSQDDATSVKLQIGRAFVADQKGYLVLIDNKGSIEQKGVLNIKTPPITPPGEGESEGENESGQNTKSLLSFFYKG